ncbi:hypothetical protein M758_10G059800 [Ceratodon purpureus]|uniref:Uncharacterized protein n=1 Tax=Ceratodon purpureus TaxID=3225 RepID=A0A8T0GL36_CERPU|nr:hypothetical protein KC19_10G063900 [Ceratodon purpureus]KAG0603022.1 hypothetical protein M758_10G059800 [Ceratodon purpureus]
MSMLDSCKVPEYLISTSDTIKNWMCINLAVQFAFCCKYFALILLSLSPSEFMLPFCEFTVSPALAVDDREFPLQTIEAFRSSQVHVTERNEFHRDVPAIPVELVVEFIILEPLDLWPGGSSFCEDWRGLLFRYRKQCCTEVSVFMST